MVDAILEYPLQSRVFAIDGISLTPAKPMERVALRADNSAITGIEKALGLVLPKSPKTSVSKNGKTALWIGPDEWLLLANEGASLTQEFAKLKSKLFSAVDVSHRNTAIQISGDSAINVLNSGCPQNFSLDAFPIGACSRTVFGKAEVVLWRTGPSEVHLECWRSFSDYVWKFLVDSAKAA